MRSSTHWFVAELRDALERVDDVYYSVQKWHGARLNDCAAATADSMRQRVRRTSRRYGERVFCYELYHQLRKAMEERRPQGDDGCFLQAELKKERVDEASLRVAGLQALSREYMPDFLVHQPGSPDHQEVVMEVKCMPRVRFAGMKGDLLKIQEFITRYRYDQGVLLVANASYASVNSVMRKASSVSWLRDAIHVPGRILLLSKEAPAAPVWQHTVEDVICGRI